MPFGNNRGTDQTVHQHSLISASVVHYMYLLSIKAVLAAFEFSSFKLILVAG